MKTSKGFTLIELAVVIAIIAILAAVAIPKFSDATSSAECSQIKNLVASLSSAAGIYTAAQSATPAGFTDFVTTAAAATNQYTIGLGGWGTKSSTSQSVLLDTITIGSSTFKKYNGISYGWNGGSITFTSTKNGASTACTQ